MFAKRFSGALCILVPVLMVGCASEVKLDPAKPAAVESRNVGDSSRNNGTNGVQSQVTTVDLSKNTPPESTVGNVVYFDLDSYVVKDEFRAAIEGQAKAVSAERGKKMVIEGHTDERGGSEYNLALGQKRAQAVLKSLTLMGAPEGQLEAVSFGKERPAVQGHDESAWSKNRRAEMVRR
jgi:peptidoglycan-associated lipoprotein